MARNAHPEVTRQRILDAAKSCSRKRGMSSAPQFKIFSTSSKTSAKALSTTTCITFLSAKSVVVPHRG